MYIWFNQNINVFVFKIPANFWCRNLSNCLLKAIDKASDILMFVLPPNLQNCSLLEFTPHQSVLFPLHPPILFLLLLFLCCYFTTCSQWYWALASLLLFLTLVGYSHTHAHPRNRAKAVLLDSAMYVSI